MFQETFRFILREVSKSDNIANVKLRFLRPGAYVAVLYTHMQNDVSLLFSKETKSLP